MAKLIYDDFNIYRPIKEFSYPIFSDVEPPKLVSAGSFLPNSRGFGYKPQRPLMSFNVSRAAFGCGAGDAVKKVVRDKFRSSITPNYIWQGVLRFGESTKHRTTHHNYTEALEWLKRELKIEEKLVPISFEEAVKQIPSGTSPGLPFIRSRPGMKKGEVYAHYLPDIKDFWHNVSKGKSRYYPPDCAAMARSHISDVNVNKVRPVWAFPASVIALEGTFAYPLLHELTNQRIFPQIAYGMEMLKGGMTWLNNKLRRHPDKYVMLDYSSFDASIPAWVIRDIFNIIKQKFILSKDQEVLFARMVKYFINTPIQNCDGRRFLKDHGVPSGSLWTNIIDSFVNAVILRTTMPLCVGCHPRFLQLLGDDSVMAFPGKCKINLLSIAKCIYDLFGVHVNVEKSYWTNNRNNVHFLGYYNYNGEPVKQFDDLFAALLFPDTTDVSYTMDLMRAAGIQLASCGNCPKLFRIIQRMMTDATAFMPSAVPDSLDNLKNDPRFVRELNRVGAGDWDITPELFMFNGFAYPQLNCTKILKNI